jgi:Fe-S-cluster containining protein
MNQVTLEERQLRQLLTGYGNPHAPRAVFAATSALTEALDNTLEAQARTHGIRLNCTKGCYYCCHIRVEAFAPEIFRIKNHLEETLPPDRLNAIRETITDRAQRATGLSPRAYNAARISCAFLVEGMCSIYSVRPAMCHIHHSTDVEACKSLYRNPEDPTHGAQAVPGLLQYAHAHLRSLPRALQRVGVDAQSHELHQALDLAFSLPDAYERWASGEDLFAPLAGG